MFPLLWPDYADWLFWWPHPIFKEREGGGGRITAYVAKVSGVKLHLFLLNTWLLGASFGVNHNRSHRILATKLEMMS